MKQLQITPIILAAGDSTRMGFPKALLPIGKDVFLTRILNTLEHAGLIHPTIVLGSHASRIQARIPERRVRVVINPDASLGQLSSIRLALAGIDPSCEACMLWPVDQPAVSEHLVRALVALFVESGATLALPLCGNKRGHPAVFSRALFREIMETPLHEGLKRMVSRHGETMALLPTNEISTVEDIDTPTDYLRLTGERLEAALARTAG